ncbi:nucleotidyltransferase domain-containing protein [Allostreptomyces psammosilenae]|uniref:Polymerase nucleotidyl transferase domain-containing protein n=1 Tax=Allostreptomyces psammosilenae TaxID=1892865 RepID=A0A853A3R3_9ACTN|nr:nucleotidyltransferase domain-containing protein [Allostreptomyces psammosilenae]NYI05341.1 hypothetical protein [Allostreptomyces psammosilenae]
MTTARLPLLDDAAAVAAAYTPLGGYAIAYGSHATGHANSTSDLDLLLVHPATQPVNLPGLTRAVIALHHRHGLGLDTEVRYENKLAASDHDVDRALALEGYSPTQTGDITVRPVPEHGTDVFLNTTTFRLRLVLNALTTGHVFLAGDPRRHSLDTTAAERSVALLATSLLTHQSHMTVSEAVAVLVQAPTGEAGHDWLGYEPTPALHSVLRRGLTALVAEHVIDLVPHGRFRQDDQVRRAALAHFTAYSAGVRGPVPASMP